jgi:hypothetical protein
MVAANASTDRYTDAKRKGRRIAALTPKERCTAANEAFTPAVRASTWAGDQVGSETEDLRALPELNARPLVFETMELPRSA